MSTDSEVVDVEIPPRRSFKILAKKIDYTFTNISEYRIRIRGHYKYLTVDASPFRENLLFQHLSDNYHIPQHLHDAQHNWTSAHITVRQDYYNSKMRMWPSTPLFDISYCYRPLKTVQPIEGWEKPILEVSSLVVYSDISDEYQKILHADSATGLALARYMPFESDVDRLFRELQIYHTLDGSGVSPHFYSYIEEEGRVIGFLHENMHSRKLLMEDVPKCKALLERLHAKGVALGNLTEDSFIFAADRIVLHDFEHATLSAPKEILENEFKSFLDLFRDHDHDPKLLEESQILHPMEVDSEGWNIVPRTETAGLVTVAEKDSS